MKWIGQHIYDLISRFRNDVYLEDISSGTIASGGNLGLDSNNKIVKQADTGITDLHGAGVDGSANQLLTDDGDGTVTSESTLTYDSETLTIGVDDDGQAIVKRLAHSDEAGGTLSIQGGDAGGTDKVGGDLRLYSGAGTGVGYGGDIHFYAGNRDGSSGSTNNLPTLMATIDGSAGAFVMSGIDTISGKTDADFTIASDGSLFFKIDADNDETSQEFSWRNYTTEIMNLDESGNLQIDGGLTTGTTSFVNSSGVVQVATQGTIDHDSLANFVAAEHYDWSSDISGTATIHANNITDLHGAGVSGSAGQILTDDGDGTVTPQSTLSYSSEILDIGADDNGAATIRRLRHTDEAGGELYIRGGDATGTNKAGGDLQIFGGRATGNAAGGAVIIQAGETNASSGATLRGVNVVASFRSDGDTLLQGNLIFEGESPDAHETTFSITDPTGDRTVTVPDADVDLTKVRAASATLDGVVELATTAEADTGTDTTRAITAAGLKSHVDARFSYQYIPLTMNATTPADGDWMYASGNGISNHLYNQNGGAGGTTPHNTDGSASTITLSKNAIVGGIIVPYDCVLVGFYAHSRSTDNDQKAIGIFTGTAVWNDYADITGHLRAYSAQDISAGPDSSNYNVRPVEHSVLNVNKSLSAGDQMWPAQKSVGGSGGGCITSMTIVLKTLIP